MIDLQPFFDWYDQAKQGTGDAGCDFLNDGGWDVLDVIAENLRREAAPHTRFLVYRAMMFARHHHRDQVRKYTGNPYADHLAEVAGITASVMQDPVALATAWLHDVMEDCGVSREDILLTFGTEVALGVEALSDLETGNRAARKAASRIRLSQAPGWVQTIKCADMISNTSSIVKHDPKFAVVYLEEKRALLDVLTRADKRLMEEARSQAEPD